MNTRVPSPTHDEQPRAVPPTQAAPDFSREWKEYARRYYLALGMLIGWGPACFALFLISRFWLHIPYISLVIMVVWLGLAYAAVWWAGEYRCPRCFRRAAALGTGKHVGGRIWRGLFDRVCSNCKLRRWENG